MDKLDLILQKLDQMDERQQRFEDRLERLEERQQRFEERQNQFEQRLDILEAGQQDLLQLTKAIMHRQELADAKLEALTLDVHKIHGMMTAFQASQERQDKILEILSLRSLEQEGTIRDLRRGLYAKTELA